MSKCQTLNIKVNRLEKRNIADASTFLPSVDIFWWNAMNKYGIIISFINDEQTKFFWPLQTRSTVIKYLLMKETDWYSFNRGQNEIQIKRFQQLYHRIQTKDYCLQRIMPRKAVRSLQPWAPFCWKFFLKKKILFLFLFTFFCKKILISSRNVTQRQVWVVWLRYWP